MLPVIPSVTAVLVCVFLYLLFKSSRIPKDFPPGPGRLPLVGSLFFIPQTNGVLAAGSKWFVQKFGKLVGVFLGPFPAILCYDYEIAKELFNQDVSAGRPNSFIYKFRMLGAKHGLMFNDEEGWKAQRRYVLKTLKDFGFGKKGLEGVLLEEADRMGDYFREKDGEPTLVVNLFNVAILNVLWQIVANHRYDLNDPRAMKLVTLIYESIQAENMRFLVAMPMIRFILPEWSGWNKQRESVNEMYSLMKEILKQHKETFDEDNLRDFVDVYLNEMKTNPDVTFTEEELLVNAFDLFGAGSETTSTTLAWAVCYMILNPDIQTRVQTEIDTELGGRPPCLEDRKRLSLTEATIMEIQRLGSIAPMAVPHRALSDIQVRGYKIPKNTLIWSILYHIMRDPDYWSEPETFNPDRFLDESGRVMKEERFVPFGIGKRICIGESMAKAELFIIFTRLLQMFTFQSCEAEGHEAPSQEPLYAFINSPRPFYAKAIPR